MPKMRGFKPEIWTDEKFVQLSPLARLLFMGMWSYACDNGHLENKPWQIKMRLLPADDCDVSELIDEVVKLGMVKRTNDVLTVHKLAMHQRIDKRYFLRCEHCAPDVDTTGARSGHAVDTTGARSGHTLKEGSEGSEGEGERTPTCARGTRIPDSFTVTDEMKEWASDKGYNFVDLEEITDRFTDYWRGATGKNAVKRDWVSTWRNWVRRDVERGSAPRLATVGNRRPEAW